MRAAAHFVKFATLLSFLLFFVITGCSSIGGNDNGNSGIGDGPDEVWLLTSGTSTNENCIQAVENDENGIIAINEISGPLTSVWKIDEYGYKTYVYTYTDAGYIPVGIVNNGNGYAVLTEYFETSEVLASRLTFFDESLIVQSYIDYTEPLALDPAALAYDNQGFYYEVGKFDNSNTYYGSDIYVRKMAANGSQIWYEEYGTNLDEYVKSAIVNTSGNLVIAGNIESNLTNYMDFFVKEIDGNGDIVMEYTGDLNGNQWCKQIIEAEDGNYYLAGYSNDGTGYALDAYVLALDNTGAELWDKRYGGNTDDDGAMSITEYGSDLVVTGYTESDGNGAKDIWVFAINTSGTLQWEGTDGGSADDQGNYVFETEDGGFIYCGYTKSYGSGGSDVRIRKLEAPSTEEE